jgi:hypothetical protein
VSTYQIADPFLAFWYRFVEPARSRLGAGQVDGVLAALKQRWSSYLGGIWEGLAREGASRLEIGGESWLPAQRWWGAGLDKRPLELDLLARHATCPERVLVGEAKVSATPEEIPRLFSELADRAHRCPELVGKSLDLRLWVLDGVPTDGDRVITGHQVLDLLP